MNRFSTLLKYAAIISFANSSALFGQIVYSGAEYTQDFDGLTIANGGSTAWANNSTLTGWYATASSITGSSGTTGGGFFAYGSNSSERALGSLATATTQIYGLRLENDSGSTLTQFDVSYDGEQWRRAGNTNTTQIIFEYSLDATSIDDGGATWTQIPSLTFTTPQVGASPSSLDGNTAANRVANISGSATALSWEQGTDLWIRWNDVNDPGTDHGQGIDNVSFSATSTIPEVNSVFYILTIFSGVLVRCVRKRKS